MILPQTASLFIAEQLIPTGTLYEYAYGKQPKTTIFLFFLEPKFRHNSLCRCERLSLERVIQILENFGFSRKEAIVYIYLAKAGPRKGRELRYGLKMTKQQLYYGLKRLHQKKVIARSSEHPALFSALAFEELLNLFIRTNVEQAKTISETKVEVLNHWRNLSKEISDYPTANQAQ